MKRSFLILFLFVCGLSAEGQNLEWVERQDTYHAGLGQNARIPIRIRNTSDKAQTIVIRRASEDLNANQKGYFCIGDECYDKVVDQVMRRLEPGETANNVFFVVETGLLPTSNSFRVEIHQKGSPQTGLEHSFSLNIEEKPARSFVFQSRDITIHDVYPNPVTEQEAYIDYRLADESVQAKVVIHNILGSPVGEHEMPSSETRVKIQAEEFSSGVYFYTVYLDNVGVLTRKLVVRK